MFKYKARVDFLLAGEVFTLMFGDATPLRKHWSTDDRPISIDTTECKIQMSSVKL